MVNKNYTIYHTGHFQGNILKNKKSIHAFMAYLAKAELINILMY